MTALWFWAEPNHHIVTRTMPGLYTTYWYWDGRNPWSQWQFLDLKAEQRWGRRPRCRKG